MRVDRCKRCGKDDLMYSDMFMCQSCRVRYEKIKEKLNNEECVILDDMLNKHFNSDSCGCNYENDEDIHMCPIEKYENGCSEEEFIQMIKNIKSKKK